MGETVRKPVVFVREKMRDDEASHVRAFLDAASGKQGLWDRTETRIMESLRLVHVRGAKDDLRGRLVILCGRRVGRAFGLEGAKWFELRHDEAVGAVYAMIPLPSTKSKWWPREHNLDDARNFLLGVIDHFSVRCGQPAGTFADIVPTQEYDLTGDIHLENRSPDRPLLVHDGRRRGRGCALRAGHFHDFTIDKPWRFVWGPRLCAPAALAVVKVGGTLVETWTRGLTTKELDGMVTAPPAASEPAPADLPPLPPRAPSVLSDEASDDLWD